MDRAPRPDFYVYVYFDMMGVPLYVGKGRGERWNRTDSSSGRNPHFVRTAALAKKSGFDLPRVKIRENLTESDAFEIEVTFIKAIGRRIDNTGPLLNLTIGGEGISGFRHSESVRKKLRDLKTGLVIPEDVRRKISSALKGRPKSDGHGFAVSTKLTGVPLSAERRAKISASRMGQKLTPEQRQKRREVMNRPEVREKLRQAQLGKKASASARENMTEAQKASWAEGGARR